MIRALICKLLGHKEKRVINPQYSVLEYNRICVRCQRTRFAKTRKRAAA
jgi:hypothetical protein